MLFVLNFDLYCQQQEKALSTFGSKAFMTYYNLVFLLGISYCS